MKNKRGFTLIEILLVVAIISALAAMVIPRLTGRSEKAKIAAAQADIRANLSTALKMYEVDIGIFPTSEQGLNSLLTPPADVDRVAWQGPYLERKPLDPWKREYQYKFPGERNPTAYDLYSMGGDGVQSEDDIGNWQ